MTEPTGVSQARAISSSSDWTINPAYAFPILLGMGVLIAVLHETLRWPLKMPGHHGMELMAVTLFARCMFAERYAAGTVGLGNAGATALLGHGMAMEPVIFLVQGVLIDLVYPRLRNTWFWVAGLALLAGAAHAIKPLVKWGMQDFAGIASGSLVHGLGYPLMTHLVFGAIGGLAAALAWKQTARLLHTRN